LRLALGFGMLAAQQNRETLGGAFGLPGHFVFDQSVLEEFED